MVFFRHGGHYEALWVVDLVVEVLGIGDGRIDILMARGTVGGCLGTVRSHCGYGFAAFALEQCISWRTNM